ncbi:hypothetical protein HDU83_003784 [Entophlyctis luteolus]|nr:hypothetical protein HDU83_003784 [Entophlyctis luteolus]
MHSFQDVRDAHLLAATSAALLQIRCRASSATVGAYHKCDCASADAAAIANTAKRAAELLAPTLLSFVLGFDIMHVILKSLRKQPHACAAPILFLRTYLSELLSLHASFNALVHRAVANLLVCSSGEERGLAPFSIIAFVDVVKTADAVNRLRLESEDKDYATSDAKRPEHAKSGQNEIADGLKGNLHQCCEQLAKFTSAITSAVPDIGKVLDKSVSPQTRRKCLELLERILEENIEALVEVVVGIRPFLTVCIEKAMLNQLMQTSFARKPEMWSDGDLLSETAPLIDRQGLRHLFALCLKCLREFVCTAEDFESTKYSDLVSTFKMCDRSFQSVELLDAGFMENLYNLWSESDTFFFDMLLSLASFGVLLFVDVPKLELIRRNFPVFSRLLDVQLQQQDGQKSYSESVVHILFAKFVAKTGGDPSVHIDLLMSPETHYLEFIVEYCKYTERTRGSFFRASSPEDEHSVKDILEEVATRVEALWRGGRGAFPYNPLALVRRIERTFKL